MRSLADALSHAVSSVRTAGVTMSVLRLVLLVSCLGCLTAVQPLAAPWSATLAVLMLACVALPDSVAPTLFVLGVLVTVLAHGRPDAAHLMVLTLAMALIHWSAVQCARGPLQTRVRLSGSLAGGWWAWLAISVAAAVALAAVAHLAGTGIPGGLSLVALGVLAALGGLVGVLLLAHDRQH